MIEALWLRGTRNSLPRPPLPPDTKVIYRGWMLSAEEYKNLGSEISKRGASLFTDAGNYLATHHLPNWYPKLKDITPETQIFPADCDLESELRTLNWQEYFVKDFVKSLKTSIGSRITKPEQVPQLVAEMRRFRGTIEGGFCVRRVEPFVPETEQRFFVINSVPFSSGGDIPPIVQECAKRIQSGFFSIDTIQRADGVSRIVEVGDGQVSDLVGWTPQRFAAVLAESFQPN